MPSIIRSLSPLFNISTIVHVSYEISKILLCQEEQLTLKYYLLNDKLISPYTIVRITPVTHLSHTANSSSTIIPLCKFQRQKYEKEKQKNAHALLPNTIQLAPAPVSRPRLITIVITAHRGVVFQFCRRPLERAPRTERGRERRGEKKISLSRTIIPRFPWDYPNLRRPVGVRSRIREHIS